MAEKVILNIFEFLVQRLMYLQIKIVEKSGMLNRNQAFL